MGLTSESTGHIKNRLFLRHGHECAVPAMEVEDLPMFHQSSNILIQIQRMITRFRMCSEINYRARAYLPSQRKIYQEHQRHLKYLYIVHPFSDWRSCWEYFMIAVYFVLFIMIPLDICFYHTDLAYDVTKTSCWMSVRFAFGCVICLLDVIMSFSTGYCDSKRHIVVLEPTAICKKYICSYFFFDIISSMPFGIGVLSLESHNRAIRIISTAFFYLSALKFVRCVTFVKYCLHLDKNLKFSPYVYKIKMLIIVYLMFHHVINCLSIFVMTRGLPEVHDQVIYNSSRTAMPFNLMINVETTYLFVMYETSRLINTGGFAWVNSSGYCYYSMTIWFIAKLINFMIMAYVVDVVMSHTSATQKYFELTSEINDYMKLKQLPVYLQKRLLTYFEFQFQRSYFREKEILASVSTSLRQEIQMHSCRKLVENVKFFKDLPTTLLLRIVDVLNHETFMTNDVIIKANSVGDCMYFIATGTVAIYARSGKEMCHLGDGNHFGEVALVVPRETRIASVVATECSELYRLDRLDFIRAVMPYPDLMLKIQRIAQERLEETGAVDDKNVPVGLLDGMSLVM